MENIIQEKINNCKTNISMLKRRSAELKKQLDGAKKAKGIDKWIGNVFESSSGLTEEYAEFYKDIKSYLKKMTAGKYEMELGRGHFYFSGFFKNLETGKWGYIMSSDVRYSKNKWYTHLLVRTAKDNKDYSGGQNMFSTLPDLLDNLNKLSK